MDVWSLGFIFILVVWTTGVTGAFLYTGECSVEQESLNYMAVVWNLLQDLIKFDVLIMQMNPVPISYSKRTLIYVVLCEIVIAL